MPDQGGVEAVDEIDSNDMQGEVGSLAWRADLLVDDFSRTRVHAEHLKFASVEAKHIPEIRMQSFF